MINIKINDKEYSVEEGLTVLQAAEKVGVEIPRFCAHEYLKPAGLCRMCLVEIKGARKLQTSCTTPVKEGLEVWTESEAVVKAREEILKLHFANHPIDCPECDQAGECSLQEYYDKYGFYKNPYIIKKEKREKDIELSDKLILDRERCILCLRCVRFTEEILGDKQLFVYERGNKSYISTYEEEKILSDYSGNIAEICPVGAITDRNFRFKIRNWFLEKRETICPLCNRGCNIYVETPKDKPYLKNYERFIRVKSRDNSKINKSFICDTGRYKLKELEKRRNYKSIYNMQNVNWVRIKKILLEHIVTLDTIILSSWLTNGEIDLALSIFREYLNIKDIFYWGRKEGEEDNILIKKDKNPNTYYLKEKKVKNINDMSSNLSNALIFGDFFEDNPNIKKMMNDDSFIIMVSPYLPRDIEKINLLLPVTNFFEKGGDWTNFEGIIQKTKPIFTPEEEIKTEFEILQIIDSLLRKE
jgi:NADH-quinone oxidoreductase subunit G